MTISELIAAILHQLEAQFYCDLPRRDFLRDEKYLVAAIGTYGYECKQRGWDFDAGFIYGELCRLLQSFKRSGSEIVWMPMYLQRAIRQHIGEHADELREQSRNVPRIVTKVIAGVEVAQVVIEPSAVELAAAIYADVRRLRRANRRVKETNQCQLL